MFLDTILSRRTFCVVFLQNIYLYMYSGWTSCIDWYVYLAANSLLKILSPHLYGFSWITVAQKEELYF